MRAGAAWGFIAVGLALTACEPAYPNHPQALIEHGAYRRVGCVEIGLEAERDATLGPTSVLVQVTLENHCNEPRLVDLNRMVMWADRKNGDHFELTFYDPRTEIVPLHIEAQAHGIERLVVDGAGTPGSLKQVCFDPSLINGPTARHAGAICYRFDHEADPEDPNADDAQLPVTHGDWAQ